MNRRPQEFVFQRCQVVLFILEERILDQHFMLLDPNAIPESK